MGVYLGNLRAGKRYIQEKFRLGTGTSRRFSKILKRIPGWGRGMNILRNSGKDSGQQVQQQTHKEPRRIALPAKSRIQQAASDISAVTFQQRWAYKLLFKVCKSQS
jgi:hypothetical protein